ncbi:MAG: T9SS type A sorting domain-containing protein [Crocinitomicaceae bacterium]|nr:T9SS type A sorting domain-containing protein [Crocinitomicaceae bacterium]
MKKINLTMAALFILQFAWSQSPHCVDLDGTNDYIYVGDVNDLGVSDFTLEAWIYIDDFGAPSGGKIISKGLSTIGTPNGAGYGIRIGYTGATQLDFSIHGNGGNYYSLTYDDLYAGKWYHIAGVRKGDQLLFYVNCVLVKTMTIPLNLDLDTNLPLSIGALDKGGFSFNDHFFDGNIDEVRIWTVARSERELCEWRDCAISTPMPNLIALYNMDQSTGTVVPDNSGNGNNGTLLNGGLWEPSTVATACYAGQEEENMVSNLYVYPNPSKQGAIYIKGAQDQDEYIIYDLSGKQLLAGNYVVNEGIDVSGISNGSYIMSIQSKDQLQRIKFIVE